MRNGKHIDTSKLRQVVRIQRPVEYRDSVGDVIVDWEDVWPRVFADIQPLSAREFIAAANFESSISARITIHFREGVTAKMRIVHGSKIYNIHGVLADMDSGREYLTLPCSEGTNEG